MKRLNAMFKVCCLRTILICFTITLCEVARSQSPWKTEITGNFGCNIFLNFSRPQKFPGFRVFGALCITGIKYDHFTLHYGPSLSIYSKTIGANLNPLIGDIQIDFTNTVSVGYGWGGYMGYYKKFRTLHNGDFYNMVTKQSNAAYLSTNFILNNHRRNQITGAVSASFGDFSFNYNNDGPPFNLILGDSFDRYWTGGGSVFFHNSNGFNRVEFSYDQFTGYQPLLYELANIIGINVPLYQNNKKIPTNYNTSIYHLKIGIDQYTSVDLGVVGSLIDRNGKYYGIQDIIHLKGHFPFHPNKDKTRVFIGGSYSNLQIIQK